MKRLLFIVSAALMCCAVYGTGVRDSLFLGGTWTAVTENVVFREVVLPGSADENRLGTRNSDTSCTSGLTRLWPFEGVVTYTKSVRIPRSFSGKRLRLVLERTKPSVLLVDGDSIGSFGHILSPHVYELPHLKPGMHEISLTVDNSPSAVPAEIHSSHAWSEASQTNWNGVLGQMFIEASDPVFISSMKIYPDVEAGNAVVRMKVVSNEPVSGAVLNLSASAVPCGRGLSDDISGVAPVARKLDLRKGVNEVEVTLGMGDNPLLWSEFHPHLYRFDAVVRAGKFEDSMSVHSGMRDFAVSGTSFTVNGFRTFLRGKHDACVFPLTGYPPMSVREWRKVFARAKEYGINHYRFHSWTPPEAAFEAADMEGIYLQVELPLWGEVSRENKRLNAFLQNEAERILDEYGNHPSFVMMSLGNELHGDTSLMREWVERMRSEDGRHLYCFGSNNNLGWNGPQEGEDYFVACRVGWGEGFSMHTRTTFAFADAEEGGVLNGVRPCTSGNYSKAVAASPVPLISHENCQFQSYPDFSQIGKYSGVLYPYNLEIFRKRLADAGMEGMDSIFAKASGEFAAECFKADLEYAFRTPGFGGFQMLDLQDYPGQGTALVGVLDVFMDSKGAVSPEKFRGFCAPVVLLAEFDDYCLSRGDTLDLRLAVANYEERDWTDKFSWSLSVHGRKTVTGENVTAVQQGGVAFVGRISLPVEELAAGLPEDAAFSIDLRLWSGDYSNSYRLWVYPDAEVLAMKACPEHGDMVEKGSMKNCDGYKCGDVEIVTAADERLKSLLDDGKRVLLVPEHSSVEQNTVGGMFIPDFWNWSMFKTISERAGKTVSPGTLSVLCDPEAPLFSYFPNEGRSGWQWWSICRNSRPLILDSVTGHIPLVQVIDNAERCHRLGLLAEISVGNGSLLVCMTDLDAVSGTPEGAAFRASLLRYLASPDFRPSCRLSWDALQNLLYGDRQSSDIQGVENRTDYSIAGPDCADVPPAGMEDAVRHPHCGSHGHLRVSYGVVGHRSTAECEQLYRHNHDSGHPCRKFHLHRMAIQDEPPFRRQCR